MRIPEYDDPALVARYGKRPATTRAEVRVLGRLLAETPTGGTVLDVPCGKGRLAPFLRTLEPDLLVGADGSREMARHAREVTNGSLHADASRLPFGDRVFDTVVSIRLLHHFPDAGDRRGILAELARVARTAVVVTFYRRGTLEGLRRRFRPKRASGRVGLGKAEFLADLRAAGLEPVRVKSLLPGVREQTFVLARPLCDIIGERVGARDGAR